MSKNTQTDATYDVGYGKPPKGHQFRKGQTGNLRGRKRGEENIISVFKRLVLKQVKIKKDDTLCTVSLAEAVILKNYSASLQKNASAMSNIFRLIEESGEFIDQTDTKQVGLPLAVPEKVATMEEFLARHGRTIGEDS